MPVADWHNIDSIKKEYQGNYIWTIALKIYSSVTIAIKENFKDNTVKFQFKLLKSLPANPLPNSKPFVAGKDIAALASSASSLSKTGEPSPY